jgi:hypothetical protein
MTTYRRCWALGVAAEELTCTFHDSEWPSATATVLVCASYLAVTTAVAARCVTRRDV